MSTLMLAMCLWGAFASLQAYPHHQSLLRLLEGMTEEQIACDVANQQALLGLDITPTPTAGAQAKNVTAKKRRSFWARLGKEHK